MRRVVLALLVGLCCATAAVQAQSKKKPAPAKPVLRTEAIAIECPNILGDGVTSGERYCDIVTASDVKNGTVIRLPKHRGVAVVSFELHNRQMYSAELVRSGRGYTRALATIVAAGMDGTVLQRNAVLSEFRQESDLIERISGGAGPGGVKAVAPTGTEHIEMEIPSEEESVTILGEKLSVLRVDGIDNFSAPGRPVALVSNVMITYRPAAARKATRRP
jgi:hypothetical protein